MNLQDFRKAHCEILNDIKARANLIASDKYFIFIFSQLDFKKLKVSPKARKFILSQNEIYEYFLENQEFKKIPKDAFYQILDDILDQDSQITDAFLDFIQNEEKGLFKDKNKSSFLNTWFYLNKELSYMQKIFLRNAHALQKLYKSNMEIPNFNLLEDEQNNLCKDCEFCLSKLETLYNFYFLDKSDKMNKQIFILTVISSVFLPINFIVGFFGINTQNLFFANDPKGTIYVVYLILSALIFMSLIIPAYKFLIKPLKNKFQYNQNIYKNLNIKIQKNNKIRQKLDKS